MYIHYSKDASDDLKKSKPLPFSDELRVIPPKKYEKLVAKNVAEIEEERLLVQNGRLKKPESKKRGNSDSTIGNLDGQKNVRIEDEQFD